MTRKQPTARPTPGRKTADGATHLVRLNCTIRADQRDKFDSLGGSVWLRGMIDQAKKIDPYPV